LSLMTGLRTAGDCRLSICVLTKEPGQHSHYLRIDHLKRLAGLGTRWKQTELGRCGLDALAHRNPPK
jgi:hypothetical protein